MKSPASEPERSPGQLIADCRQFTRRIEWLIWWRGVLGWLTVLVATVTVLVLADCLLRREEAGLRWLAVAGLVGATGYAAYRLLIPAIRFRARPVEVVGWIERQHPGRFGQLLIAVELAEIDSADARYGSQTLREAAFRDWHAGRTWPQWHQFLDHRGLQRRLLALAAVSLVGIVLYLSWPAEARLALQRLGMPWSTAHWPRRDLLEFVNLPVAVGIDASIQLEVTDRRPPLPDDIVVEVRPADQPSVQPWRLSTRQIGAVAIANLPPLEHDVEVRAVGGEDQLMPWQPIRVVAMPQWQSHEFTIVLPDYLRGATARPPGAIAPPNDERSTGHYRLAGQQIQVLSGSRVSFEGQLDRAVQEVGLGLPADTPEAEHANVPWNLLLSSDQQGVRLSGAAGEPLRVEDSFSWSFVFELTEGVSLTSPRPWKIEVVADAPPLVELDRPVLESLVQGLPLRLTGVARDDWGLRDVSVKLACQDQPDLILDLPLVVPEGAQEFPVRVVWDYVAELASHGITLGQQDQILVWLEVHDLLGQSGKSRVERLVIETREHQLDAIGRRRQEITQLTRELAAAQQSSLQLGRRLREPLLNDPLTQSSIDSMAGIVQVQQSIAQRLSQSPHSVLQQAEAMRQLLRDNQLLDSQLGGQVEQLIEQIENTATDSVSEAYRAVLSLHDALELAATESVPAADWTELADRLERSQTEAWHALHGIAEQLDATQSLDRLQQALRDVASQQAAVSSEVQRIQLDSLGRRSADFEKRLRKAAAGQQDLSVRLDEWLTQLPQPVGPADSPAIAQVGLDAAAAVITQRQLVGMMRTAAGNLRQEQLGQAVELQSELARSLSEALRKLSESPRGALSEDSAPAEQHWSRASRAAEGLAKLQAELARQWNEDDVALQSAELAGRQQTLNGDFENFVSDSLLADKELAPWIEATELAQQQVIDSARNGDNDQAAKAASSAATHLEELSQQLQQRARQGVQQTQQQQLQQWGESIQRLIARQSRLLPEYQQLAEQVGRAEADDYPRLASRLMQAQEDIRRELRTLRTVPTETLLIFQWVLDQVDMDMAKALAATQRRRLDPEAIEAAGDALRRLKMAVAALGAADDESLGAGQATPSEPPPEQTPPPPSSLALASLRLVRSLQWDLRQQTAHLEQLGDPAQRSRRLLELTQQQHELGMRLEQLLMELQSSQNPVSE